MEGPSDSDLLQTALDIAARWRLSADETCNLFALLPRTFDRRDDEAPHLQPDQRTRISHLANIDIALEAIFNGEPVATDWLRRPNENFGEHTPLAAMLEGGYAGILDVRAYLERLL